MTESFASFSSRSGVSPHDDEADLDRFFALSLDLLCIAGLDGYFRRVNPSWTRVLGWSEAELLSRPVAEFMHPEDRERTLQARARLAKGIPVIGLENRYLCKDGSYRWLSWQSSLYREGGLVIAIARDITERRQSDEEHLVLSKLESTGMLAAGIAHDFNNLLASLLLNLEMVRMVDPVSDAQQQHLRQAQETVRAAQSLSRQLVSFAENARAPRRVLDLRPLLRGALELGLAGSLLRGECDFEPDLWPAEVEEAQIKQLVRNLVANAREAMPEGGVVMLSARNVVLNPEPGAGHAPGRYVCFSVTDRGAGIAAGAQNKLFDPYFTTKRRGPQKGMGLGLTICHAILRQHGGHISVEPRPGGGTEVRCCVPAARDGAAASAGEKGINGTTAASALAPAAQRVLVMDDEPWLLDVMAQTLEQIGYEAVLVKDGDEAIARCREAMEAKRPFDVALLDLTVRGGMGGREVVVALRELDPELRAVLMTGYDRGTTFLDYPRFGFQAALSKPFTVDHLRTVLAEVIAGGVSPSTKT